MHGPLNTVGWPEWYLRKSCFPYGPSNPGLSASVGREADVVEVLAATWGTRATAKTVLFISAIFFVGSPVTGGGE